MIPLFENIKKMDTGKEVLRAILKATKGRPAVPGDIAEELKIAQNSLSNIAKKFEDLGIISREVKGKYIPEIGALLSLIIDEIIELDERISRLEKTISK